jgi:hypothetical protein
MGAVFPRHTQPENKRSRLWKKREERLGPEAQGRRQAKPLTIRRSRGRRRTRSPGVSRERLERKTPDRDPFDLDRWTAHSHQTRMVTSSKWILMVPSSSQCARGDCSQSARVCVHFLTIPTQQDSSSFPLCRLCAFPHTSSEPFEHVIIARFTYTGLQ